MGSDRTLATEEETGPESRPWPAREDQCAAVFSANRLPMAERNILQKINDALRSEIRLQEEREAEPSVVIVDSQSVQTAEKRGPVDLTRLSARKVASAK